MPHNQLDAWVTTTWCGCIFISDKKYLHFSFIFLFDFYQKNNDMSKVKVECNGNKIGANGVLHCSIAQRNFDFIQYER